MREEFTSDVRADEAKVKALMDYLIKAFEDYCNDAPEEVKYLDAFMAVHNFHCVIILDMERRQRLRPAEQLFYRQAAVETFRQAMENKPALRQGDDDEQLRK